MADLHQTGMVDVGERKMAEDRPPQPPREQGADVDEEDYVGTAKIFPDSRTPRRLPNAMITTNPMAMKTR